MRRAIVVALGTGAFISSAAALSIGGTGVGSEELTRSQYEEAQGRLERGRNAALARCEARAAAAAEKEVCRTEVLAGDQVRGAELEQSFRRTEQSARALQRARIDARYQLDRAQCGMLGGFKRDKCLVQAHAARGRAMLDAAAPYEAIAARY